MDEVLQVADDDDVFVFVKYEGIEKLDKTTIEDLLGAESEFNYFKPIPGKPYGYAEFKSVSEVEKVLKLLNDRVIEGVTFKLAKMPAEPVYVPVSRNPEDTKFRADLNRAIKARAHDRLVYHQSLEKEKKKEEKQRRQFEAEKNFLLDREQQKAIVADMDKKVFDTTILPPTMGPVLVPPTIPSSSPFTSHYGYSNLNSKSPTPIRVATSACPEPNQSIIIESPATKELPNKSESSGPNFNLESVAGPIPTAEHSRHTSRYTLDTNEETVLAQIRNQLRMIYFPEHPLIRLTEGLQGFDVTSGIDSEEDMVNFNINLTFRRIAKSN